MNTATLDLSDRTESSLRAGRGVLRGFNRDRVMIPHGDVAVWREGEENSVLRVVSGVVWVTQQGRPGDHILGTGQCFRFANGATVVAESLLGEAVVELQEP